MSSGSFQVPPARPPIRKLFSSITIEDTESNANENENDTFRVFLRIKPNSELNSLNDCIKISNSLKLICKPPLTSKFKKLEKVEYTFSHIFGPKTTQGEIFSKCIVSCVEDLLLARNSLIFAYGTTNAGKTFTVQGSAKNPGIIPQALHTLFCNIEVDQRVQYKPCMAKDILKLKHSTSQEEILAKKEILRSFQSSTKCKSSTLSNNSSHFMQVLQKSFIDLKSSKPTCSVWISFLEVYNETIYDLLDPVTITRRPLKLAADHCDNFYVKELKQIYVSSAEEAFTIYQFGKRNLNVASTKMNENSSRSHCIFTIHVINLDVDEQPIVSKLCICDLAGTERLTKTQNTGQRLKESGNINGSLFQLNRCLRAIRENQTKHSNQHQLIPYRHSNLTKLLHSALDDRTDERIIMIVNINPSAELYDETQQVLKMCAIASKIKNKPITNKPQQSSRFTTLIYGRENNSNEDRDNDFSDYEDDISGPSDELEIQELKERLQRQEEEIARLHEQMKFREVYHENTKNNLKEYCEKIESTYKNRVKSLEERLRSQKEYYLWKIDDVKKNMFLENFCDENVKEKLLEKDTQIQELEQKLSEVEYNNEYKKSSLSPVRDNLMKEELSRKDAQIEELEKKLLQLQHDDVCRKLSFTTEMQEKDAKNKEFKSLIEEAKNEYLFLQKKFNELVNELCDKNDKIENLENALNSKQNAFEELEQKLETLEEKWHQNTIDHETILHNLEKDRDSRLAAQKSEIERMNLEVELLKQSLNEKQQSMQDLEKKILGLQKDHEQNELAVKKYNHHMRELEEKNTRIEELEKKLAELQRDEDHKKLIRIDDTICEEFEKLVLEQEQSKVEENTKRYNTRKNNRTPAGKENRFFNKGTPVEIGSKSKKGRKPKTPLGVSKNLDDSEGANLFRNIPEKVTQKNEIPKKMPTSEKKKLFSNSSPDLYSYDSFTIEPSKARYLEMTTPAETVKLMKKRK